jgi:hypothetical protein
MANRSNVQQSRLWRRIDQEIKITALDIIAMNDRTKNPRITRAMRLHNAADIYPVYVQKASEGFIIFSAILSTCVDNRPILMGIQ